MPPSAAESIDKPRARGRPPLAAEDLAERRWRIIDAAARLFFADGFAETSVEAIGRQAGVTKRTIYELVGDKQALFHAACNKLRADGPQFTFNVPVTGRSARAVLIDMARQLVTHSLDPELIVLERAVIAETGPRPGMVSDAVVQGKVNLDRTMARIFDRLVEEGSLPPLDTARAAPIFYDVAVGARGFRAVFGHPDELPDESEIGDRVDMFLVGYVARMQRPAT